MASSVWQMCLQLACRVRWRVPENWRKRGHVPCLATLSVGDRHRGRKRGAMLDRQKLETILMRRFPGASPMQIAAAANGIMGLGDEWEEVAHDVQVDVDHRPKRECGDTCILARDLDPCGEFRVFRRRFA